MTSCIPESLKKHVTHKIITAVQSCNLIDVDMDKVSRNLLDKILCDPSFSCNPKIVMEIGTKLSKAIRVYPDQIVSYAENSTNIDINQILTNYDNYLVNNNNIFYNITTHHNNLNLTKWNDVANNTTELAKYSTAAEQMGDRLWVQQGNDWMKSFTLKYFTQGGAKKHHLRVMRDQYMLIHGSEMPAELNNAEHGKLAKNVMSPGDVNTKSRRIRLLDVGSCYNPLNDASADSDQFEVTALDLYPVHSSVMQCDFLNLKVGDKDSQPIIVPPNTNLSAPTSSSVSSTQCAEEDMHRLYSLPAGSFDAVTMSLVLNYLPSAAHREVMVAKARQLLVGPSAKDRPPHHRGLLLVVEKQSIFGKDSLTHPELWHSGKGALLQNWKQSISNHGFELVKYRTLDCPDGHRSHLFAFAAVDIPTGVGGLETRSIFTNQSGLTQDITLEGIQEFEASLCGDGAVVRPRVWIKQDFDINKAESNVAADEQEHQFSCKRNRETFESSCGGVV
jgi:hypothetical protein